jgi:hypothetical protein
VGVAEMDVTGPGTAGWIGCRVPHWEWWIFEGDGS